MSKRLMFLFMLVFLVACNELFVTPSSRTGGTISGTITLGGPSASREISDEVVNVSEQAAPVVLGEVIVQFESGLRSQALQSLSVQSRTGETQTLRRVRSLLLESTELYSVAGLSQAETYELVERLEARPDVAAAMPNYLVQPLREPSDPNYAAQWNHKTMNLPAAWNETTGSSSVVVAVIDSGIVATHPDFGGRVLPGYDFVSNSAYSADGDGRDSNPNDPGYQGVFHGTHVAGIIGASTNNGTGIAGVDWNARVLPVRALGPQTGTIADVLDAALWAAGLEPNPFANPNPADVLNFSLGSVKSAACSEIEQQVYDRIIAAGKIVVAAAGNSSANAGAFTPGNCQNVITVGAVSREGERAWYSNYGSRLDVMAPGGEQQDSQTSTNFTAQDGVLSLNGSGDYIYLQGTSMAAPHVSGLAALMKSVKPSITQADVRQILTATARPLSASQCSGGTANITVNDCGAGSVDAAAALTALKGVDLAETLVGACVLEGEVCRPDTIVKSVVSGSGSSVTYLLSNLSKNTVYALEAYKDTNNNNVFDAGDYYAFTEDVRPSATVNLSVSLYRSSSSMRFLNVTSPR